MHSLIRNEWEESGNLIHERAYHYSMISIANYNKSIKQVNLSSLPKVLQEGHDFFMEAQDWYENDKTVKESIDLYLSRLNEHLSHERRKSKTGQDQSFINRFVKLNDKTLAREEIGKFIQSLQRAIIKKQIRKSSLYARHIEKIQDKLIIQYNRLSMRKSMILGMKNSGIPSQYFMRF